MVSCHADDLVLCGEPEGDQKVMVWHFVEVCRRRVFKVNADKSKVMGLGGDDVFGRVNRVDGA